MAARASLPERAPSVNVVFLKSADAPDASEAIAVDELRLVEAWTGEAVLLRATRSQVAADAPFTFRWLADLVLLERRTLRDIAIASFTLSILTILPPIIVMTVVNKVLQFNSVSTLVLLSSVIVVVFLYETLLGHARRLIINVVGARLDTKLHLHVFSRLLRLPLDYFERHPAGETMYHLAQVERIREFLTGKLLSHLPRPDYALRAVTRHLLDQRHARLDRGRLRGRDHA